MDGWIDGWTDVIEILWFVLNPFHLSDLKNRLITIEDEEEEEEVCRILSTRIQAPFL